jgi:hypothetical protein
MTSTEARGWLHFIKNFIYDRTEEEEKIESTEFGEALDMGMEALITIEQQQNIKDWLSYWLSTFNTDSATECFTAVQELKEKLNGQMD